MAPVEDLENFHEMLHRGKSPVLTRVLKRNRIDGMSVYYGRFTRLTCIIEPGSLTKATVCWRICETCSFSVYKIGCFVSPNLDLKARKIPGELLEGPRSWVPVSAWIAGAAEAEQMHGNKQHETKAGRHRAAFP